jgi:hypothetical protein
VSDKLGGKDEPAAGKPSAAADDAEPPAPAPPPAA